MRRVGPSRRHIGGTTGCGDGGDVLAEAFSDFAMEVEGITPLDEQRFLTVQRFVGHFRVTGIPFDERWASLITVRAGHIIQAVGYLTKGRALRAFERGSAEA